MILDQFRLDGKVALIMGGGRLPGLIRLRLPAWAPAGR